MTKKSFSLVSGVIFLLCLLLNVFNLYEFTVSTVISYIFVSLLITCSAMLVLTFLTFIIRKVIVQ